MALQRQTVGDRGISLFGGINVGGGTSVKKISTGTFSVDTSSIGQSAVETGTFTLPGATTGDIVFVIASTLLNAGLSLVTAANVTATSTVTVQFVNETSAAIVQTSELVNRYLFLDIT